VHHRDGSDLAAVRSARFIDRLKDEIATKGNPTD
jgi:hypothetical protein